MKNFLRNVAASLCIMVAAPAVAQSQAEKLALMMSKNYAMQSLQALMLGDRAVAVEFALRALPSDPTDDEIELLPDAMFALELSAGSRIIKIDVNGEGYYSVDSTGTRAFAGFHDPRPEVNARYFAPAIYDQRDGSLIRILDAEFDTHGLTTPEVSPVFSPDGSILALPSNATLSVHLYRASDGEYLGEMKPDFAVAPKTGVGLPLGFSQDGGMYALGYLQDGGGILVWNVADLKLVHHLPASNTTSERSNPLGWDHENGFAVQIVAHDASTGIDKSAGLERWTLGGERHRIGDLDGVIDGWSLRSFTFDGVPVVFMTEEARLAAIDLNTGETRFTTEVLAPEVALVRGGTAFAIRPFDVESLEDFQVFDLVGNRLQPMGRDLIPLAQAAFTMSGQLAGMPKGATRHTYLGADLPERAALYQQVWQSLSDADRRAIDQDRVMRP